MLSVRAVAGRGRGAVARGHVHQGTSLLVCTPIAAVLKQAAGAACSYCAQCMRAMAEGSADRYCGTECARSATARGADILARADLRPLERLQKEQGRKFPLLAAQLLANLLNGLKVARAPPSAWSHAMELCHAVLHPEALAQVTGEHATLLHAFADAGIAPISTLELLMPLSRYSQILGACQLNAFELRLSHGALISCLLPSTASMFNHSCTPNILVHAGETTETHFIAAEDIAAGDELCISYAELGLPCVERQAIFQFKYGFACDACNAVPSLS
eukprot:CAMPEP_0119355144 /NCGR_PEP_ID=MMETSP1334-20130426/4007_1 /TAXON_ID=127549 /ORGANISM="Calcidiscus leptoporus, Strain RCC1130" /LENGTH=274 /DNA_ID=CAMNT_0007368871 /DNA_START=78 /DNA_END=902 /DNA_ORIENTATION=-